MMNCHFDEALFKQEYAEWAYETERSSEEKPKEFLYGTDFWDKDDEHMFLKDKL